VAGGAVPVAGTESTRARQETEEHGGASRKTEDLTVKRRKLRGLTIKHE
jgi:hypothetical protein